MPIRSLIAMMEPGPRARRGVLYVLSHDPRLHVGERFGAFVPIVTEPISVDEGADLIEQLRQVPGIRDVILTAVSDVAEFPRAAAAKAPRPSPRPEARCR